eukprot:CAMPEP_0171340344 /NCGR_PEP_ID=MMETSP0878-20121228/8504_1 /TAXON_ID=67004 /ORGANISM="Thalassiosira weissflogii, Strain CCMP1336" /LENGTH=773 /DNA_ID=CAMNT_0011842395 /DNA_START=1081 /DNA_END=3402 /DNA_ORIENTATION=+
MVSSSPEAASPIIRTSMTDDRSPPPPTTTTSPVAASAANTRVISTGTFKPAVVEPPPRPLTPNPDDTDVGNTNFDDSEMTISNTLPSNLSDGGPSQDCLPPITTASLPSERQLEIRNQTWGKVSSRSPLGCRDHPPSFETLVDFAATIIETRLADVVKHRRDVKLAPPSNHSSMTSEDGGAAGAAAMAAMAVTNGLKFCGAIDVETPGNSNVEAETTTAENSQGNLPPSHGSASAADAGEGSVTANGNAPVVLLTSSCRRQIREYVRRIAGMYRDNRYHALEHAVHVTMSANKLLEMLHEGTVESDDDMEVEDAPSSGCGAKSLLSGKDDKECENSASAAGCPSSGMDHHGPKFSAHPRSASVPRRGNLTKAMSYRIPNSKTGASSSSSKSSSLNSHGKIGKMIDAQTPSTPSSSSPPVPRPKRHKRSSTYLIYSSTFTKFSFVFAAYIHDVDHQGVPNARLVHENDPLAELYSGKSIAEKHSIKVAFRTLGEPPFDELRSIVFESPDDKLHMHRIVTNLVISTDIASPERMQTTKLRWEEAFSPSGPPPGPLPFGRLSLAAHSPPNEEIATVTASEPRLVSLKDAPPKVLPHSSYAAEVDSIESTMRTEHRRSSLKRVLQRNGGQTVEYFTPSNLTPYDGKMALRHSVVIETMINVADVAHSMQSWELFCFWNRNLYEELYDAYKTGRSENDPAKGWYENQLFFYKIYVLPLAEKMKTCGVFGDLGGEFYRNALSIRDQWEREGDEITKKMIASVELGYRGDSSATTSSTSS